jgi:hypothetical protein
MTPLFEFVSGKPQPAQRGRKHAAKTVENIEPKTSENCETGEGKSETFTFRRSMESSLPA